MAERSPKKPRLDEEKDEEKVSAPATRKSANPEEKAAPTIKNPDEKVKRKKAGDRPDARKQSATMMMEFKNHDDYDQINKVTSYRFI